MSENYIEKIQYGDTEYEIRDSRLSDENSKNKIKIGENITLNSEKDSETNLPFGDITVGNLKLKSIERPSSTDNAFSGYGFELSSTFDGSDRVKEAALTLKKEELPDDSEEYISTNSITLSYNGISSK